MVFLGVGKEGSFSSCLSPCSILTINCIVEKVPDTDIRGLLSATVTQWKALSDTIFTSHQELLDSVLIRDGLVFMI